MASWLTTRWGPLQPPFPYGIEADNVAEARGNAMANHAHPYGLGRAHRPHLKSEALAILLYEPAAG